MSSKPRFVGEKVKLGDVLQVVNGKNQKAVKDENGQYPIYGSGGQMGWASSCICPADTVIIGRKGNINKPIYVSEPFWNVDTAFGLVAKPELLDARYLYHFCKHYDFGKLNTTCTIPSLTRKNIEGILLRLPSLGGQKETAAQLDSILKQIALAQQEIAGLDSLVKSRFVEMFEESDRYNGSVYRLADIGEIASGITKGRKARDKELFETPYLSTANVQAGRLDLSVIKTIDATMPEIEKFRLAEGDVLMTEGGDPDKVGRGAVAHNLPKNCIHQNHVFRVRLNRVILYPEYFEMFLQSPGCREYFFRASKQTTGIATINKTQLRNMQVLVPPIKAQEEFLAFASQVDKSRFLAQQQIEKLQMLYDSLAQDYFGD